MGATLYHLLTNEPPPDAKSRYLNASKQAPLSIRSINPNVSPQTEQAVLHLLGLHPEDRPRDIEQVRQELIKGAPIVINGHMAGGWSFAIWRNRVLLALVAALLILAAILTFIPGAEGQNSAEADLGVPYTEISR